VVRRALVHLGRGALGLVQELLALVEAAQLVGAAGGDDGRDAPGFLALERGGGGLLGARVAPLEEGDERVAERLTRAGALALGAVGAYAGRDRDERLDEPREQVEGEVAREDQHHHQVERELHAPGRRHDDHVAARLPREERDAHRERGEDDGPEGEAHGATASRGPPAPRARRRGSR
jgi:hypothetical protein